MDDIWKDVVGYEGYYQVSNLGRVRSLDVEIINKNNFKSIHRGRMMKIYNNPKGYSGLTLCKNQRKKFCLVHRLVADAFIPNPNNLPQINHIDENAHNNKADNLEWCTQSYNNNYGNHNKKLSETQINNRPWQRAVVCVDTGVCYCSCRDASRNTGIRASGIWKACAGLYKQSGGYKWRFANNKVSQKALEKFNGLLEIEEVEEEDE